MNIQWENSLNEIDSFYSKRHISWAKFVGTMKLLSRLAWYSQQTANCEQHIQSLLHIEIQFSNNARSFGLKIIIFLSNTAWMTHCVWLCMKIIYSHVFALKTRVITNKEVHFVCICWQNFITFVGKISSCKTILRIENFFMKIVRPDKEWVIIANLHFVEHTERFFLLDPIPEKNWTIKTFTL